MAIMVAKLTTTKKSTFNLNYVLALNTTFTMLQNNVGDMVSLHTHLNFCDKLWVIYWGLQIIQPQEMTTLIIAIN